MAIIHDVNGNILKSRMQTLVCPVNTIGVMGRGLALEMAKEYTGLLYHYRKACKTGVLRIDNLWMFKVSETKQILCFPTKEHWINPSKIEWIDRNLDTLANDYKRMGITSLGLPRLGCGLGQLEWEPDVRPLVYNHLAALPIQVMVYGP